MTEQFAPPVFSEAVYAGIRRRVLREIETEAPAWPQTIASLFRSRLTWSIASVLLLVVSIFAIYFMMNRGDVEQPLAHQPPARVQEPQVNQPAELPPAVNTGEKKLAGVAQPQRKRVRVKSSDVMSTAKNVSSQPSSLPEPVLFPPSNSAAVVKPLRVEIQTKDPMIRIIWFVQPETKPTSSGSKGT